MDFALTEEQTLVQRTTREFAQLLRENGRQSEADGPSATLRRQYEALELGRLDWCAQAGGADLGSLMKALVVEELAAGCAGSTLALDHATLGYYGAVQAGPRGIELAKRAASDDGFVIAVHVDVDKQLSVDDGRLRADIAYVPARPPSALFIVGEQLWLVDDGIEATAVKSCGLGAAGGCALKVDAEATAVEGSAQQLLAHSRIYIAACLVGVARAAHEYALAYTLEREAFGRKVAHHQGIAFMLAENRVRLDAARVLLHAAAVEQDDARRHLAAAQAFVEAADASLYVTNDGVQLLGGHGYVKDHPVEKYYREARTLSSLYGGRDGAELDAESANIESWRRRVS